MIHAREDYNRIQDPEGKIPEDEPVFLIRGQDIIAPDVLRYYAEKAREAGSDINLTSRVIAHAELMEVWQTTRNVKVPDIPKEQHAVSDERQR